MSSHYLKLAVPAVLNAITMQAVMQMNIIFLSHMGDATIISGAGLGNMTVNILCLSLMIGLNGAIDTLVSQTFG
jgi:Na+-driven multidrug efflux pump